MKIFGFGPSLSREVQFWNWFGANCHRFSDLKNGAAREPLFDELSSQLNRVGDLAFEFSLDEDKPREFILSADGDKAKFPLVEKLVAAAPAIPGWQILAFRPRKGTEFGIQFGDVRLGSDNLFFSLEGDGEKVGMHLFFEGVPLSDEIAYAALLLLDTALGEYDMETKVGFIERHELSDSAQKANLKPFSELPAAFDAFYNLMHGR